MIRTILISDSEPIVNYAKNLEPSSYELTQATSIPAGMDQLRTRRFDLILIDADLSQQLAVPLAPQMRSLASDSVPVIFLSSRGSTEKVQLAFDMDADDFIAHSVCPDELRARVNARLRHRRSGCNRHPTKVIIDHLKLDLVSQKAFEIKDDVEHAFNLTPTEFKILVFISCRGGRHSSGKEIAAAVWQGGEHVVENSIYNHIYCLRKKLGSMGARIQSFRGKGYVFK